MFTTTAICECKAVQKARQAGYKDDHEHEECNPACDKVEHPEKYQEKTYIVE